MYRVCIYIERERVCFRVRTSDQAYFFMFELCLRFKRVSVSSNVALEGKFSGRHLMCLVS